MEFFKVFKKDLIFANELKDQSTLFFKHYQVPIVFKS